MDKFYLVKNYWVDNKKFDWFLYIMLGILIIAGLTMYWICKYVKE